MAIAPIQNHLIQLFIIFQTSFCPIHLSKKLSNLTQFFQVKSHSSLNSLCNYPKTASKTLTYLSEIKISFDLQF
uniref:Uncharacterized protein n=1 Tax=Helianthus annuus TaxID=4232 RepID=A0A251V9E8_HELAN